MSCIRIPASATAAAAACTHMPMSDSSGTVPIRVSPMPAITAWGKLPLPSTVAGSPPRHQVDTGGRRGLSYTVPRSITQTLGTRREVAQRGPTHGGTMLQSHEEGAA